MIRPGSIDMICNVPMDLGSHENYADWSDEKRAELLAKLMTAQQERERVKAQADKKRSELVASARAKLTDEEIQAIYEDAAEYP